MDLITYLDIIRRRWILPVGGAMVAVLAVWVTLPASAPEAASASTTYVATTTMIATHPEETTIGLPTIALLATVGEVPKRAASRLRFQEDPQILAATVTTAVDQTTSTLTIASSDTDGPAAARRANVFANELVAYFEERASRQAEARLDAVNRAIVESSTRVEGLDRKIAANPGEPLLEAERTGLQRHHEELVTEAASLRGDLVGAAPVEVLQRAVPVPTSTEIVAPPSEPWQRILIGAGLGLVLGFALALVVERLDSRLRQRDQVEDAFKLPVLAEIPARPWRRRHEISIASATDPGGAAAEAYRALRSSLLLLQPARSRDDPSMRPHNAEPTVVLVTSCRPAEGKTSTVANLAVVMAESGRSVLVLSLDFRNPRVQDYLDVPARAGLSDLLSADRPHDLDSVVRDTAFPGVRIATSGQETNHPGALLTSAGRIIEQARKLADVVLIDTAPMLTVSDAVDLSPHVDAVVVVSRVNRTTTGQARAAHRILTRLGVPALGAVLVGVSRAAVYGPYPASISLAQQLAERLGVKGPERRDERASEAADRVRTRHGGNDDE
jgi:capsular exopolysaccharide synthesis family protein